jgi:hypothetical protein
MMKSEDLRQVRATVAEVQVLARAPQAAQELTPSLKKPFLQPLQSDLLELLPEQSAWRSVQMPLMIKSLERLHSVC